MVDRCFIREGLSDQKDGHIETSRMLESERQNETERKTERKTETKWKYSSEF